MDVSGPGESTAVVLLPSMPHSRQIVTQENTLLWLLVLLANTQEKCTGA